MSNIIDKGVDFTTTGVVEGVARYKVTATAVAVPGIPPGVVTMGGSEVSFRVGVM